MKKFIILDTETTNDIECPLVYDLGFSVIDATGKVYASYSFVNADIFCDDELMASAYFAEKVPMYWEEIRKGYRVLKTFRSIEKIFRRVCKEWEIDTFVAHNAKFDYLAIQTTKRYITSSKYRFFFPYGSRFVDTLKLSREVLGENETYRNFCVGNEYVTKFGQNRYTAEIIYRFLTNDDSFEEEHTGLADCMIEKEIFRYCLETVSFENGYLW